MPKITKLQKWFAYPDDPLGGRALLAHLNEGDLAAISEKSTVTDIVIKDGKPEVINRYSRVRDREETALAMIKDWSNFYDDQVDDGHPHGRQMKCNPANIRAYAREDGFMVWLKDCREELAAEAAEAKAALAGNSPALPSGSPAPAAKAATTAD